MLNSIFLRMLRKPFIRSAQISIEFILELLASGIIIKQILKNYPQLTKKDILGGVRYSGKERNTVV